MSEFKIPSEIAKKMVSGESILPKGTKQEFSKKTVSFQSKPSEQVKKQETEEKGVPVEDLPKEIKEGLERSGIKDLKGHIAGFMISDEVPEVKEALKEKVLNPVNQEQDTQSKEQDTQDKDSKKLVDANLNTKTEEEKVKVTKEDEDKFFDSIVTREPFYQDFSFFNGRIIITMRTKYLDEADKAQQGAFATLRNSARSEIEFGFSLDKNHIAYSLVKMLIAKKDGSFEEKLFDDGTLEERLERINGLPDHLFLMISDCFLSLSNKMKALEEIAKDKNF